MGLGQPLLVDIADEKVGKMLTGYMKVVIGYKQVVVKVLA